MRVGVWSYPGLFQSSGGLQNQIAETMEALEALGCSIRYVDMYNDKLTDFDVIHIYSAAHGNHTIARLIKNKGIPYIVSPVLQAYWSKSFGRLVAVSSWLLGLLSKWRMRTEFDHYLSCLTMANHVIALGHREKDALANCFGVKEDKCDVIPNGISERFFICDDKVFLDKYKIKPGFVLCVGLIGEWKNQAMVAEAAQRLGVDVVLIGACKKEDQEYLNRLEAMSNVNYLGVLPYESPLLASAYAAAGVLCLPSISEVMPMTVLESLASGTPAVVTKNNSMDLVCDGLFFVDPESITDVSEAIHKALNLSLSRAHISQGVSQLRWSLVAQRLMDVYLRYI